MSKYTIEGQTLTDIADAIREQTGDENPIAVSDFASSIASISGGGSVNYSTTEHEVGTWIDGSTVYEKTFFEALPASGGQQNVSIAHGITGLNIVVDRSISNFIRTGESVGTDGTSQYYTSIQSIDGTNITYRTTVDGAGRYVIITIRYTKTA